MVLGHSRWLWGRFCADQDLQTVLRCHVAAFEAIGDRILALAQLDFVDRAEVVHLLGPPDTGKSHLAPALGIAAVKAGRSVYRTTLANLVDALGKARREDRLADKIRFYTRTSLFIVDEIGYVTIDGDGANLFFQLVNARDEKGAMILTSTQIRSRLLLGIKPQRPLALVNSGGGESANPVDEAREPNRALKLFTPALYPALGPGPSPLYVLQLDRPQAGSTRQNNAFAAAYSANEGWIIDVREDIRQRDTRASGRVEHYEDSFADWAPHRFRQLQEAEAGRVSGQCRHHDLGRNPAFTRPTADAKDTCRVHGGQLRAPFRREPRRHEQRTGELIHRSLLTPVFAALTGRRRGIDAETEMRDTVSEFMRDGEAFPRRKHMFLGRSDIGDARDRGSSVDRHARTGRAPELASGMVVPPLICLM